MTTATKSKSTKSKAKSAPEPTPIMGYRPRPRYRDVIFDMIEYEDGAEPFTATIRSHLTFGEIDQVPFFAGAKYAEIEEAIAPYVVGWNVMALNVETGEFEPVPPPAEAGVAAFKCLGGHEVELLAMELNRTSLGSVKEFNDREEAGTLTTEQASVKKSSTPSGATPEPGDSSSLT